MVDTSPKKKIDYVAKLKKELVEIPFNKKPEKATLKELKESAKKARENYNYEYYESSSRSKLAY